MRAYFLPAEMTYRCSRVVEQEAVELEILDLVCKVIKLAFLEYVYIYLKSICSVSLHGSWVLIQKSCSTIQKKAKPNSFLYMIRK